MEELEERERKLHYSNELLKDKLIEKEDIEKRQNKLKELKNSIPSSNKKKINKSLKRL
jgi:hypothetical protein